MALITCRECGKEVSSTASACPHCGAKVKSSQVMSLLTKFWTATKITIALIFGLAIYRCTSVVNQISESTPTPLSSTSTATKIPSTQKCASGDFTVTGLKFRREYDSLAFTGTVTNSGNLHCGVQLKVSTYDSKGAVVDTSDFWPASIRNIAPGAKENFSYFIRYDKSSKTYDVVPIDARQWNK